MQLPNHLRSAQVDQERILKQNDMAVLASTHSQTERIRKQRGELSDRRFIEHATREAWQ